VIDPRSVLRKHIRNAKCKGQMRTPFPIRAECWWCPAALFGSPATSHT
jgi:hypothetical protein